MKCRKGKNGISLATVFGFSGGWLELIAVFKKVLDICRIILYANSEIIKRNLKQLFGSHCRVIIFNQRREMIRFKRSNNERY